MSRNIIIKKKELNYRSFENDYGMMFHLLVDLEDFDERKVRFCSLHDKGKFLAVLGQPVFYSQKTGLQFATKYTIIYPKIYVLESKPLTDNYCIARSFIH